MRKIERDDHLTRLEVETVDAGVADCGFARCVECGDLGPNDKLFFFHTVRGAKWRRHDGAFCSKFCHDQWHGLAPKRGNR